MHAVLFCWTDVTAKVIIQAVDEVAANSHIGPVHKVFDAVSKKTVSAHTETARFQADDSAGLVEAVGEKVNTQVDEDRLHQGWSCYEDEVHEAS